MNAISALIKCVSIGFLVGLLASNAPQLQLDLLPLAGAFVVISAAFVLSGIMKPELATGIGEGSF